MKNKIIIFLVVLIAGFAFLNLGNLQAEVQCRPGADPVNNPELCTPETSNNPTTTNTTTTSTSPANSAPAQGTEASTTNTNANSQQPLNTNDPNCLVDNRGSGLNGQTTKICNPLGKKNLMELVLWVLNKIFALIGIVAVVVIVIAGFRLVAFAGNPKERETAVNTLTNAVMGLALALFAYVIVAIVQNTLTR